MKVWLVLCGSPPSTPTGNTPTLPPTPAKLEFLHLRLQQLRPAHQPTSHTGWVAA